MIPRHIVLAGDSIFDNDGYVPHGPGVIEQLRMALPRAWSATKVAVDGDCIAHVPAQLKAVPGHSTDLILSIGGNDARGHAGLLSQVTQPSDLSGLLARPLAQFCKDYAALLKKLEDTGLRLWVCTIYTAIPFPDRLWRTSVPMALEEFNTVIRDEAGQAGVAVLPLDETCTEPCDFSEISPIEPFESGRRKIVDVILRSLAATG